MKKRGILLKFKNNLKNIIKENIFRPDNLLRISGIFTKKTFTGPLKLLLDITDKCDMNCIMCWHHSPCLSNKKGDFSRFFPLEKFETLIKELRDMHVKTVLLCGEGEPLLHPHIETMVELCRKYSLEAEIMTNAYHLGKEKIIFLKNAGLKKIFVSLHAADLSTFRKIRPLEAKETFERIMENLLFLKDIRGMTKKPAFF